MSTTKSLLKNSAFLSTAYIGQKILSFIYFTLIARIVGVVDTGAYVFALSYSTICSVFVDFGLSSLIQREIAQRPHQTKEIVQTTLWLKLMYAVATAAAGLIVIHFLTSEALVLNMVLLAMVLMLSDSFNLTVWSAFRGHQNLRFESISIVVGQAIVLLVGITALLLEARLEILILALLAGSVWTAIFAARACRRELGFWPVPKRHSSVSSKLWRESIAFGIAGAFTRLFASFDAVLLGQLAGHEAVGFYAIPNKFVFACQFLPAALAASLYPAFSRLHVTDRPRMAKLFHQSVEMLFMLAAPMTVGLFVLTPNIIHEVYTSKYDPSILAMQILSWGLLFGFIEFPFGSLLAATNQQKKNTITRTTVVILNIGLNLILIPRYSFVGTSISAVISYALLAGMGAFWTRDTLRLAGWPFVAACAKITAAAALMGLIVALLRPYAHFTVLMALGASIYLLFILGLRVVTPAQIRDVLQRLRRPDPEVMEEV